jgi:hypothetical protein
VMIPILVISALCVFSLTTTLIFVAIYRVDQTPTEVIKPFPSLVAPIAQTTSATVSVGTTTVSSVQTTASSTKNVTRSTRARQLIVLAMHHSGTSLLTRILMEMGAYGGERGEFKLMRAQSMQNPAKFWERYDLIELNEMLVNQTEVSINTSANAVATKSVCQFTRDPGWITGYLYRSSSISKKDADEFSHGLALVLGLARRVKVCRFDDLL